MEQTYRTLGILGGMGPAATVDFMSKIIAETRGARDQDHVPMIVRNVPQIPDRSAAIMDGAETPLPALLAGVQMLEASGADYLAIPCNSAHRWYDELSAKTTLRILHIVDSVRRRLAQDDIEGPVALLSTRGTVRAGVYQRRLGPWAQNLMVPNSADQSLVDETIASVKAGIDAKAVAEEAGRRLLDAGATRLILACTELPIAFAKSLLDIHCVDATRALAKDCVEMSMNHAGSHPTP